MFVFDRSAFAVLIPLALLAGVVFLSSDTETDRAPQHSAQEESRQESGGEDQTVAANLPSR